MLNHAGAAEVWQDGSGAVRAAAEYAHAGVKTITAPYFVFLMLPMSVLVGIYHTCILGKARTEAAPRGRAPDCCRVLGCTGRSKEKPKMTVSMT
jgi:hypothetical protein